MSSPPADPSLRALGESLAALAAQVAEWHCIYSSIRPDLARTLEFYDRSLPGTMRRITGITRTCIPQCVMLRGPGDWVARPGYH
jgi:hypothetical protein